jgi:hypothetical protein
MTRQASCDCCGYYTDVMPLDLEDKRSPEVYCEVCHGTGAAVSLKNGTRHDAYERWKYMIVLILYATNMILRTIKEDRQLTI